MGVDISLSPVDVAIGLAISIPISVSLSLCIDVHEGLPSACVLLSVALFAAQHCDVALHALTHRL